MQHFRKRKNYNPTLAPACKIAFMTSHSKITLARLDRFGFLAITGKDAQKFLKGYCTCDLEDVTETRSGLGATCNIQGRMVTSFRITRIEDGFLLRMDRGLVASTMEFLKKYIVFSKAKMEDQSGEITCYGLVGLVDGYPAEPGATAVMGGHQVIRVGVSPRFEIWARGELAIAGAETVSDDEWWVRDIEDGLAWVSTATQNEFIPQMFAYHKNGGIDFDKGCYLGQEIVARMQYRGAISRKLYRGIGTTTARTGDVLSTADGKAQGMVVAAGGNRFLAVIQAKSEPVPDCYLPDGSDVTVEEAFP